jgi:alanine racemase
MSTQKINLNDPVRKLVHECMNPDVRVNANLVGFGPLEEGGPVSYGLIITGEEASVLAEMLVGYLNTLSARAEQKDVHEAAPRVQ